MKDEQDRLDEDPIDLGAASIQTHGSHGMTKDSDLSHTLGFGIADD